MTTIEDRAATVDGERQTWLGEGVAARLRTPGPTLGHRRPSPIGSVASSATRFAAMTGRAPALRRLISGPGDIKARKLDGPTAPPRWWAEASYFAQLRDPGPTAATVVRRRPGAQPASAAGRPGQQSATGGRRLAPTAVAGWRGFALRPEIRRQVVDGMLAETAPPAPLGWARDVPAAAGLSVEDLPTRSMPRALRRVPNEQTYTPGGILNGLTSEVVPVRRIEAVAAAGPMLMSIDKGRLAAPKPGDRAERQPASSTRAAPGPVPASQSRRLPPGAPEQSPSRSKTAFLRPSPPSTLAVRRATVSARIDAVEAPARRSTPSEDDGPGRHAPGRVPAGQSQRLPPQPGTPTGPRAEASVRRTPAEAGGAGRLTPGATPAVPGQRLEPRPIDALRVGRVAPSATSAARSERLAPTALPGPASRGAFKRILRSTEQLSRVAAPIVPDEPALTTTVTPGTDIRPAGLTARSPVAPAGLRLPRSSERLAPKPDTSFRGARRLAAAAVDRQRGLPAPASPAPTEPVPDNVVPLRRQVIGTESHRLVPRPAEPDGGPAGLRRALGDTTEIRPSASISRLPVAPAEVTAPTKPGRHAAAENAPAPVRRAATLSAGTGRHAAPEPATPTGPGRLLPGPAATPEPAPSRTPSPVAAVLGPLRRATAPDVAAPAAPAATPTAPRAAAPRTARILPRPGEQGRTGVVSAPRRAASALQPAAAVRPGTRIEHSAVAPAGAVRRSAASSPQAVPARRTPSAEPTPAPARPAAVRRSPALPRALAPAAQSVVGGARLAPERPAALQPGSRITPSTAVAASPVAPALTVRRVPSDAARPTTAAARPVTGTGQTAAIGPRPGPAARSPRLLPRAPGTAVGHGRMRPDRPASVSATPIRPAANLTHAPVAPGRPVRRTVAVPDPAGGAGPSVVRRQAAGVGRHTPAPIAATPRAVETRAAALGPPAESAALRSAFASPAEIRPATVAIGVAVRPAERAAPPPVPRTAGDGPAHRHAPAAGQDGPAGTRLAPVRRTPSPLAEPISFGPRAVVVPPRLTVRRQAAPKPAPAPRPKKAEKTPAEKWVESAAAQRTNVSGYQALAAVMRRNISGSPDVPGAPFEREQGETDMSSPALRRALAHQVHSAAEGSSSAEGDAHSRHMIGDDMDDLVENIVRRLEERVLDQLERRGRLRIPGMI